MTDLENLKKKELQEICENLKIDYLPKHTKAVLKEAINNFYENLKQLEPESVLSEDEKIITPPEVLVVEKPLLKEKEIVKEKVFIKKPIPKLYSFKEIVVKYRLSQYDVNYLKKCNISSKIDTLDSWLNILNQKNILN